MKTCQMTGIAKNDKGKAVCDPPKFKFVGLEKERPRRLLLGQQARERAGGAKMMIGVMIGKKLSGSHRKSPHRRRIYHLATISFKT